MSNIQYPISNIYQNGCTEGGAKESPPKKTLPGKIGPLRVVLAKKKREKEKN